MKCDFSNVNLQYLIQARDIARQDSEHAAIILGMDKQLSTALGKVLPEWIGNSMPLSNLSIG